MYAKAKELSKKSEEIKKKKKDNIERIKKEARIKIKEQEEKDEELTKQMEMN